LFWNKIREKYPQNKYHLTLIDDNYANILVAKDCGIDRPIHVADNECSFAEAIAQSLGTIPSNSIGPAEVVQKSNEIQPYESDIDIHLPIESVNDLSEKAFRFNSVAYLLAKNKVDDKSINTQVHLH
jgi:hypothetical protein